MKRIILLITILFTNLAMAQNDEPWFAFSDKDSELVGFKNGQGQVMIEPKFNGYMVAQTFDDIVAVIEVKKDGYESYYLTKSGKQVGFGSLFSYDNAPDCENEGFIRFKDHAADKVGLFDKNGEIAIPPEYNSLSRAYNGLVIALEGAEKTCQGEVQIDCEHPSWEGGQTLLLSTDNQVLIEDFVYKRGLDFYSLQIENSPSTDSTKMSFKGLNGQYYIFTDTKKDFENWLKTNLLEDLTVDKLIAVTTGKVKELQIKGREPAQNKEDFFIDNFALIRNRLLGVFEIDTNYFFSSMYPDNSFLYEGDNYQKYFDNCGELKREKNPVIALVITDPKGQEFGMDVIEFLKTDKGYRLIGLEINESQESN